MARTTAYSDWPLDRELNNPEIPGEMYDTEEEFREERQNGTDIMDRLGEAGFDFLFAISHIRNCLTETDMTPEEAIACLEYEIKRYQKQSESEAGSGIE